MDEKKLNESGEKLEDEQLEGVAGGLFASRNQLSDKTADDTPVDSKRKPGGSGKPVIEIPLPR